MKLKSVVLYLLFFITAVMVFLFLLFPEKEVAGSLSQRLTTANSNVQITIDKVRPGLPLKLSLKNVTLFIQQDTRISTRSFDIFFGPTIFFNAEKSLSFQSDFYQGSVKGSLQLDRMNPLKFSQLKLFMSNIKVKDFNYKTAFADIDLGFELNGEYKQIDVAVKKDNLDKKGNSDKSVNPDKGRTKISGQGTIFIQNFSAEMKNSLFNIINVPAVDFIDIKIEFAQIENNKVLITQCTARGPIINAELKGRVDIVLPLENTRLNLNGTILPDSPYLAKFRNKASAGSAVKDMSKQGIKFRIKGTLKNPDVEI